MDVELDDDRLPPMDLATATEVFGDEETALHQLYLQLKQQIQEERETVESIVPQGDKRKSVSFTEALNKRKSAQFGQMPIIMQATLGDAESTQFSRSLPSHSSNADKMSKRKSMPANVSLPDMSGSSELQISDATQVKANRRFSLRLDDSELRPRRKDPNRVLKEGRLFKLSSIMKKWKPFRFVLRPKQLEWYEEKKDGSKGAMKGFIELSNSTLTEFGAAKTKGRSPYCFSLISGRNREMFVYAECQQDFDEWRENIRLAIRNLIL